MVRFTHTIRARYGETDRMGLVYHGVYAQYLDEARTEMLRSRGITYREIEEHGIMMPVRELSIRYQKGSSYDALIYIHMQIMEKPHTRMRVDYRCENEQGEPVCTAFTELIFVQADKGRPIACPDWIHRHFPEWC
jgi:acyl-CoA thioester hydrolase